MADKSLFESVFGKGFERQEKPPAPKTTDKPDVKLFMLQILNSYGELTDKDGMRWTKAYRHKQNGKTYRVNVEIIEEEG